MASPLSQQPTNNVYRSKGYSLVELLIVIVVASIISLAAYTTYSMQSTTYATQREVSSMQQELRGSLYILAWDIRNALRDQRPQQRNRFLPGLMGWVDSVGNASNDSNIAYPALCFDSMRIDIDGDMVFDTTNTIAYRIFDQDADGITGLYRAVVPAGAVINWNNPAVASLVADGVQAINFAYAFDSNRDGRVERWNTPPGANPGNNAIIWAVDSDNNQTLDSILDANGDTFVNEDDDTSEDFLITFADDGNLATHMPAPVNIDRIRAVRIDLLMISDRQFNDNTIEQKVFVVGNRIFDYSPGGNMVPDRFKRRVMSIEVSLRNYIR